jgi:CRISPR/Cas system CSM-associated protein Csm3 (group 7 of RAMP superfamily)
MTNGNGPRGLARLEDLEVRLYRLTTRSHLRVGAGEGTADVAVENPIIRALVYRADGSDDRVPYIPGSSLHGVVRAWVEKALRSGQEPLSRAEMEERLEQTGEEKDNVLKNARKEIAAFLGKDELTADDDAELFEHWKVYIDPHVCDPLSDVDKCERITDRESAALKWKVAWWKALERELPCEVCRIFGYMGQRGRVKFTHAWPTAEEVPLDVITRVAINRLTGAADEGKLFDLEAIPPGVAFYFFTVLENMGEGQKDDFDKGIRALNLQLAGVGAHSTVGFGMVDVDRVFKANIQPKVFSEDVDGKFVEATLAGPTPKEVPDVDLEKLPRFFQALVVAHSQGRRFGDLITFK